MSDVQEAESYFPQELCEAFIDCLWDSKNDLQACALVSRSWLPKSRSHLFRSFKASFFSNDIRKFYQNLLNIRAASHLCLLIREIHLQYARAPGSKLQASPKLDELLPLFFSFPNLDQLSLQGIKLIKYSLFTGQPGGFPFPLPNICSNLTTLALCDMVLLNIDAFNHILRSSCLSNLRSLSLINIRLAHLLHETNELWLSSNWLREMVQLDQTPSRVRLVELELGSIKPHQDVWKYFFHPGMALDISELKRLVALRSCHPELLLGILDYVDCPRLEWLEIECLHASQTFYLGRISDVLSPVTHLALNYDIDARLGSEYAANNLLQGLVTLNGCRIEELTVFMSGYATQWTSLLKNLKSDMNIASDFYILDELLVRIIQIPGIHKVRVRAPRTWFDADGTSRPINDEANEGLELIMTKTRLDALLPNASRQGLHAGKLTVSYFDEEMIVDPVQRGGFSMWSFQD